VTAIWGSDPSGAWHLLAGTAFSAEAELHTLVEENPQILPLSGEGWLPSSH
jgi:hypothetical protein